MKELEDKMREIREELKALDSKILELLDKRMSLVEVLGRIKALLELPVKDKAREKELLDHLCSTSVLCLKQEEIKGFFQMIFGLSILRQMMLAESPYKPPFRVCVSLLPKNRRELIQALDVCKRKRVELVEFRLDGLQEHFDLENGSYSGEVILTNRRKEEGGLFQGEEKERIELLMKYVKELEPDFLDLEWLTPEGLKKNVWKEKGKTKLILSYHNLERTPDPHDLMELLWKMSKDEADFYKVVTTAHSLEDSLKVLCFLSLAKSEGFKVIGHATGRWGKFSRLLAPFLGVPFSYAALCRGKEVAPGQMTPEELRLSWALLERWFEDA